MRVFVHRLSPAIAQGLVCKKPNWLQIENFSFLESKEKFLCALEVQLTGYTRRVHVKLVQRDEFVELQHAARHEGGP